MISVLLLHRVLAFDAVVAGIDGALGAGSIDPEVVAVEARRSAERREPVPVAGLSLFDRPLPTLAHYDELLEESG